MRTTVAGLALLISTAAQAADFGTVPAFSYPVGGYSWTGGYIGLGGGHGWLNDVDYAQVPPFPDFGRGWIWSAHAGYLHQVGSVVFGAELEYLGLGLRFERAPIEIIAERAVAAKARLGVTWGNALLSVNGGAAHATTNIGLKDWGWTAGLNLDFALSERLTLGLQYSHFGFNRFDNTLIDARLDVFTARLSLRL